MNYLQFGTCDNVIFPDTPNRTWCGTADFALNDGPVALSDAAINLNPDGTLYTGWWGGRGGPVLHVEINGWGPTRAPHGPPGWSYSEHVPAGWTYSSGGVYWPASDDLSAIHVGDYVRLVGQIWKDGAHKKSAWEDSFYRSVRFFEHVKDCLLQSYTDHAGWSEMHPVDFVEKIDPPTPCQQHTLAAYFACDSNATPTLHDSFVARGQPYPNSRLSFDEMIQGPYTNWTSMMGPNNGDKTTRMSVSGNTASFTLGLQGQNGGRALYSALYDLSWTCTPSCYGKCGGDDGCNGTCPGSGLTWCNSTGSCASCCPSCDGKCGGDDGCGGTCAGAGLAWCPTTGDCQETCGVDCSACECGCSGTRCAPRVRCNAKACALGGGTCDPCGGCQ